MFDQGVTTGRVLGVWTWCLWMDGPEQTVPSRSYPIFVLIGANFFKQQNNILISSLLSINNANALLMPELFPYLSRHSICNVFTTIICVFFTNARSHIGMLCSDSH